MGGGGGGGGGLGWGWNGGYSLHFYPSVCHYACNTWHCSLLHVHHDTYMHVYYQLPINFVLTVLFSTVNHRLTDRDLSH